MSVRAARVRDRRRRGGRRAPIFGRRRDTGRDGGSRQRGLRRTRTRARAARARTRASAGRERATVLLAGEAGIGKTRLASELARRARDAGFEVLLGRSIDLVGTELPYQPFVEALRPLGAAPASRRACCGLAAAGLRGDARAAHRPRRRRARAARAGGPALGRYVDARPRRLPRPQPRRPARSPARDLPRRRPRVGRADASTSPTASGARARRRCSSSGRWSATTWRRCWRPAPTARCRPR